MNFFVGLALKVLTMFLRGEANLEIKRTIKKLNPDNDKRSSAIDFLRMHYKNAGDNRPPVDASNFKRDDRGGEGSD